jgi:hypothetical protein
VASPRPCLELSPHHTHLSPSRLCVVQAPDEYKIISIKSWNIKGDLPIKLSCPDFRREMSRYHINLFQETHLRPQQIDALYVPRYFVCFARSRPAKRNFGKAWGGVLAIVSSTLSPVHREDLSGPDFHVISFPSFILYNVYLLPGQSPWEHWTDTHPSSRGVRSTDRGHSSHGGVGGGYPQKRNANVSKA